jgi:transposase-like protein
MSFADKIVGRIIGDRKSKNDVKCYQCGSDVPEKIARTYVKRRRPRCENCEAENFDKRYPNSKDDNPFR